MTKRGEIVARGILYLFIGLAAMGYAEKEFLDQPLYTAYQNAKGSVAIAQIQMQTVATIDDRAFMPMHPFIKTLTESQARKLMIPWLRWRVNEYFSCGRFFAHKAPDHFAYDGWQTLPIPEYAKAQLDRSFQENFMHELEGHKLDDMKEIRRKTQEELNCPLKEVDGDINHDNISPSFK